MDSTINPVSAAGQGFVAPVKPASTSAPAAAPAPAPHVDFPAPEQQVPAGGGHVSAEALEASIRQAAISFKNTYAVSDHDFTIYKGPDGKYITRYVSHRDGTVTYVPEPPMLQQTSGGAGSRLSINV